MSRVRATDQKVIAIFCSDLHLSLKAPISRAGEPNWFDAMARQLGELEELRVVHDCPIICAGDIFDKWNSGPELINFALKTLPNGICAIPGQHDLPLHNYEDIKKSAYWTLVQAGRINNLKPGDDLPFGEFYLTAFPWGYPIEPSQRGDLIHIAVVHEYIWSSKGTSYPGAPEENKLTKGRKDLAGYDVAVFGDNHKGFDTKMGDCHVVNCGGFMRRNADQIGYQPRAALLFEDGSIGLHYYDTSKDVIEAKGPIIEVGEDMELQEFMSELMSLEESTLDFEEAMGQALEKIKPNKAVKELILEAME